MLVDSKILALVSSLTWAAPLTGLDRPGHDHDRIIGVHPLVCIPTSYRHASPTWKTSTCGKVLDKFTDALQAFPVPGLFCSFVNVLILEVNDARPVATEIIKLIQS
jgi:hypothetical protein